MFAIKSTVYIFYFGWTSRSFISFLHSACCAVQLCIIAQHMIEHNGPLFICCFWVGLLPCSSRSCCGHMASQIVMLEIVDCCYSRSGEKGRGQCLLCFTLKRLWAFSNILEKEIWRFLLLHIPVLSGCWCFHDYCCTISEKVRREKKYYLVMRMLRTFVDAIGEKNCNVFFPDSHILTDKMLVRPKSCWNLADILWFKKLCHKAKVSTNRTVSDPCLKYILCLFISILLLLIFIRTRFCGFCCVSFVLVVPVERWNTSRLCSAQRKKRTIWSWCLGKCHTSSGHVWIMISHDFCFIIFKLLFKRYL